MFNIVSNIEKVIADLSEAKAKIASAPSRLMRPEAYLPILRSSASTILNSLTLDVEKDAIPAMLATVVGYAEGSGMVFEMSAPTGAGSGMGIDPSKGLTDEQIDAMYPQIMEWVADYKDKTSERDTYAGGRGRSPGEWQTNEAIAARIAAVLKNDPQPWLRSGATSHGVDNPDGLMAFMRDKHPEVFGKDSGLTALSESRASELILAVLSFWHDQLGAVLNTALIAEVNKALD